MNTEPPPFKYKREPIQSLSSFGMNYCISVLTNVHMSITKLNSVLTHVSIIFYDNVLRLR